ncbi:sulfur carrier protein ThiS [Formosa haliotis]|uniref:sulfur carrier protein ThiS n=1 Tax=Formosa haliotis TaxID=1555194 RepID=UPI000825628C|nr:sulfur carrier protein ThiS [Formosa haliotis]
MISIRVNDSEQQLAKHSSLATLMHHINPTASGMAVAVNNQVVPKTNWEQTELFENDAVLIITATQGG